MAQEITVEIPEGCRLIGTRTDENKVIIIFEPEPESLPTIGYARYRGDDDDDDDDDSVDKAE
jgi:hypothetical protein